MTIIPAIVLAASLTFNTTTPPSLDGRASWYEWHPRQAAAGPRLRAMIGKDWRGKTVKVCVVGTNRCVLARLTDWCQCFRGTTREVLIDLDYRSFKALVPLSRGIIKVRVTP